LVYLNLHQDDKAKEAFEASLNIDQGAFEARWGVAEVMRRQHEPAKAATALKDIVRSHPEFSPAYISLAYIKYMDMDFEGAVRLALIVMQMGREKVDLSNYVRAYCLYSGAKGMIAHYGGPLSKAINGLAVKPNLDKAEKLQPNSPGVLFGLGSYYFLAPVIAGGDKRKAETYLKRAIEVDPLFVDAYIRLAQLYKIRGEADKYDIYIKKASSIDPDNELLLDQLSGKCKFICIGGKEE
jgi:Tfp pilus assembly protein PilF